MQIAQLDDDDDDDVGKVFWNWKLALSNSPIVLLISVVVTVEINMSHYFLNASHISRGYCRLNKFNVIYSVHCRQNSLMEALVLEWLFYKCGI